MSRQGGAEHKIPVVISKISKEQKGMLFLLLLLFQSYSSCWFHWRDFFFFPSWTLWTAFHWRWHPSGKMPKLRLNACSHISTTLQNNTFCVFNNSSATCPHKPLNNDACLQVNVTSFICCLHPSRKYLSYLISQLMRCRDKQPAKGVLYSWQLWMWL